MWGLPEKTLKNRFYNIDQSVLEKFQNEFGVDRKSIEETVAKLIKWASEQSEFPEESRDPEFIENVYASSKYNEERAKKMISGHFNCIKEYPQFFRNIDNYKQINFDYCSAVMLEKLTNNGERVMIFKNNLNNMENYNLTNFLLTSLHFYLLNSHFGGVIPIRLVLDFKGLNYQHYKTLDLSLSMKYITIFKQGLKYRVIGIHYLNAPASLEALSNLVKFLLSPKLTKRILIHENLESLHEYVPKDILPKEYGGPQYTWNELNNTSISLIEENKDFYDKIISLVPKDSITDTVFGAEGTFKTLTFD